MVPPSWLGLGLLFSLAPQTLFTQCPIPHTRTTTADPTSKLRELLIEAKESGLTWEGIFSNFTPTPETIAAISQKDFAAGLQKLSSDTSCTLTSVRMSRKIDKLYAWIRVNLACSGVDDKTWAGLFILIHRNACLPWDMCVCSAHSRLPTNINSFPTTHNRRRSTC